MSMTSRRVWLCVSLLLVPAAHSQIMPNTQPPVWSAQPDVASFEKAENEHLVLAHSAIDKLVGIRGPRTIDNTLTLYDEVIRQLNTAIYFPD